MSHVLQWKYLFIVKSWNQQVQEWRRSFLGAVFHLPLCVWNSIVVYWVNFRWHGKCGFLIFHLIIFHCRAICWKRTNWSNWTMCSRIKRWELLNAEIQPNPKHVRPWEKNEMKWFIDICCLLVASIYITNFLINAHSSERM